MPAQQGTPANGRRSLSGERPARQENNELALHWQARANHLVRRLCGPGPHAVAHETRRRAPTQQGRMGCRMDTHQDLETTISSSISPTGYRRWETAHRLIIPYRSNARGGSIVTATVRATAIMGTSRGNGATIRPRHEPPAGRIIVPAGRIIVWAGQSARPHLSRPLDWTKPPWRDRSNRPHF